MTGYCARNLCFNPLTTQRIFQLGSLLRAEVLSNELSHFNLVVIDTSPSRKFNDVGFWNLFLSCSSCCIAKFSESSDRTKVF